VQFPWRFLGLIVFGAAICATAVADRFAAMSKRSAVIVFLAGIVLIMATYFPYYSQVYFFVGDDRSRSVVKVSATGVEALRSAGTLIPFGLSMSTAELRAMHERATSSDDFLPRDVKEKPSQPPVEIMRVANGRIIQSAIVDQNHYRSLLQMSAPGKAELLQFWFPGWQTKIDGLPVPAAPAGPEAIVSSNVPAGEHIVEFSYRGPPQRTTGIIISIFSAAIGACVLWFLRPRQQKAGLV
jgi:hypothetical protein